MNKVKPQTKLKEKSDNLTERLNQIAERSEDNQIDAAELQTAESVAVTEGGEKSNENQKEISDAVKELFDKLEVTQLESVNTLDLPNKHELLL